MSPTQHSVELPSGRPPQQHSPQLSPTHGDHGDRRPRASTFHAGRPPGTTDRVPSYYDVPSLGEPTTNNHGGRGPLITIRKMLGIEGGAQAPPTPRTPPREAAESFDSTYFKELPRAPPSPLGRPRDSLAGASMEGELMPYKSTLIHISPSLAGSSVAGGGPPETRPRTSSIDLFKWPQKHRKQKMRRAPGGLYRVVQSTAMKITDERMKSYVVVEIFEGHQFIKDWKCGDLVHYVNHITATSPPLASVELSPARGTMRHHFLELERQAAAPQQAAAGLPSLSGNRHQLKSIAESQGIHHHYYFGAGRRPGAAGGQQGIRSQVSQLTYRDLRQVFTDGAPVPSIEVRRNCLIVCLPPLSCLIMKDRVFLLVVEDMDTDRLIASLEEMQLRHMGRYREAHERSAEKSRVLQDVSLNISEKPSKRFWRSTGPKTSETITRSRSAQDIVEQNKLDTPRRGPTGVMGPFGSLQRGISQSSTMQSQNLHIPLEGGEEGGPPEEPSEELPIEFETLELLVSAAFEQLDSDIAHLERQYVATAEKFSSPSTEGGEDLHILNNHVRLYTDRVMLFDKVFDEIIAAPEVMVKMELSRQKEPLLPSPEGIDTSAWEEMVEMDEGEEPNPDLEILLEFFDQELEMFRQRLSRLSEKIESTERLITLKLSLARNTLLRWDVASTMAAAIIGCGTLLSGIFGMNLRSDLEDSKTTFDAISIGIAFFTVLGMSSIAIIVQTTRL